MGKKSFEDYFSHFSKVQSQSLHQSREVLLECLNLGLIIEQLQKLIQAIFAKIDKLRQERKLLNKHEADIIANKDFIYEVNSINNAELIFLQGNTPVTVLRVSTLECHDNCIRSCAANYGETFKCCAI